MTLPKIDAPIYETTIHSTNKKIKYRPYLVKEKKILMIAYESKDPNAAYTAVKQIVNNCTFGEMNVETLALFDLQNLFLKIRSKSVGEEVDFGFECPKCKKIIKNHINFENLNIKTNKDHNIKIQLTDSVGVVMKYPTIFIEKLFDVANDNSQLIDLKIITNCIDYIYDKEEIYRDIPEEELNTFVESLTESQLKKIEKFFETMPKLEYKINYSCECGDAGEYEIKDFYSFFD